LETSASIPAKHIGKSLRDEELVVCRSCEDYRSNGEFGMEIYPIVCKRKTVFHGQTIRQCWLRQTRAKNKKRLKRKTGTTIPADGMTVALHHTAVGNHCTPGTSGAASTSVSRGGRPPADSPSCTPRHKAPCVPFLKYFANPLSTRAAQPADGAVSPFGGEGSPT
jgi:hypothetical protein